MKHNHLNLKIWQKSRGLVKRIYEIVNELPSDEKFGLSSQMKRCVVSIPSNIAEGCGRDSDKQLALFLGYAIGSCCELETQLFLVQDLNLIKEEIIKELLIDLNEIRMMIMGFQKKLSK